MSAGPQELLAERSQGRLAAISAVADLAVRHRRWVVVCIYALLIVCSNYLAFALRFDGAIPASNIEIWRNTVGLLVVIRLVVFIPLRLHEGLWRYASIWDLQRIIIGVGVSSSVFVSIVRLGLDLTRYPRSVYFVDSAILIILMGGLRMVRRLYREARRAGEQKSVLIFGAGDAGELVLRDMKKNPSCGFYPIGFIDDDSRKVGSRIHGVPVLGTRGDLRRVIDRNRPDELLIAMPREPAHVIRDIVRTLQPFNVPISTLPSLGDMVSGKVTVRAIRPLAVEDLLRRPPIGLDSGFLVELIAGKRVLVTGAGGSIGSELCRQVAKIGPELLVLVDRYENSLFDIATDLSDRGHHYQVRGCVGDITDVSRMRQILTSTKPHLVFHAAAHKHVPIMELNPGEAVKNNVRGTRLLAEEAERHGVERFILISTDKAVNPTSVMGATKRVAEFCMQAKASSSQTTFSAVRFGNVLASRGSVVPRFLEQIKAGGPVTVTHPEIQRYFMLIPEAVQLVLHAAALAEPGAVFVLDMGHQIKVADMARSLIRLSGYVPEEEIKIEYVGLRPGEKLYEELLGIDERAEPSSVAEISRVRANGQQEGSRLFEALLELEALAAAGDDEGVVRKLCEIVPTFKPNRAAVSEASAFPTSSVGREGTWQAPTGQLLVPIPEPDQTKP